MFREESGQTALEYLFLVAGSLLFVLLITLLLQEHIFKKSYQAIANKS